MFWCEVLLSQAPMLGQQRGGKTDKYSAHHCLWRCSCNKSAFLAQLSKNLDEGNNDHLQSGSK